MTLLGTERPHYGEPSLLHAVARKVLDAMPVGTASQGNEEDAIADIEAALRSEATGFDEYRMTRYLDDRGWMCDSTIVDAFSIVKGEMSQAVRNATALWVKQHHVKPRLDIGASVKVLAWEANQGELEYEGEVVSIDAEQAKYTVMIPALGHVRTGCGTHGLIVPFEKLHEVGAPADVFQLDDVSACRCSL